ncbi:MAG: AtpZ/AtpI family protein, partial [Nitrospirota bacterium]
NGKRQTLRKEKNFSDNIEKSAKNLLRGRKEGYTFWHYAYVLGIGGWLLAIPIVGGAYLGKYLDGKIGSGGISWTLTCILIGIAMGIYNVWYFLMRKSR